MRNATVRRTVFALVGVTVLVRFAVAALAPIVKDEAYYLAWSTALDWGYFDHPPAVACLGVTALLSPSSAFAGRLGGLLVGTLAIPFCVGLFRRSGLSEPRALTSACALAAFNLSGLTCGILVVPDTLYFVAWCAALQEAAAALDGNPRRWLTAGVAAGLGLLSKYMMVLIFPVLFIAALRGNPRQLRSPWPWAGVLLALAIFSPHLAWNARNDWVPVRFQLLHGSGGDQPFALGAPSRLPALKEPGAAEIELAHRFGYEVAAAPAASEPSSKSSSAVLANLADYLGAVASWWGALIVVVIGFIVAKLRGRAPTDAAIPSHLRPLLFWSALFPVAFFGVASLRTHVEANWPAAYTVGACAFLASYAARHARLVLVCSAVNVLVLVVVTLHARAPFHASNSDRVLKETRGYRELAELVGGLDGPVFVDRHQTGGLLRFYLPNREITQWPGLTRPSELVRRPEWQSLGASDLAARGSFLLVTASGVPRGVEGFHASEMRRITVRAVDGRVETTIADAALPLSPSDTGKSFHRWHVTRYVVDEPPTTR